MRIYNGEPYYSRVELEAIAPAAECLAGLRDETRKLVEEERNLKDMLRTKNDLSVNKLAEYDRKLKKVEADTETVMKRSAAILGWSDDVGVNYWNNVQQPLFLGVYDVLAESFDIDMPADPREKDVLRCLLQMKPVSVISAEIGLSGFAVRRLTESILKRLKAVPVFSEAEQ